MIEGIVIGVSAGGMNALKSLLPALPASFPAPIAVVQHIAPDSDTFIYDYLNRLCALRVKEAEDKEPFRAGTVYIAPVDYHLLIEPDRSLSLSCDQKINHARPAIDPLFESAAVAFGPWLAGVILTGGNHDGAQGLKIIKQRGGVAIVQSPEDAEMAAMPIAALNAVEADYVVKLEDLALLLMRLCGATKLEREVSCRC